MKASEYATCLNDAIECLKVRRNVLATADLLTPASSGSVSEIRRCATELEVLAIDLTNAQHAETSGHRATLED